MKNTAIIRVFQPGIVRFNPCVLHAFVQAHLASGEAPSGLPQPHPPQGYGLELRAAAQLPETQAGEDFDFALPLAAPAV
ncbi:MAG TPA: hypothetical protein DCP40_13630 [Stenotrophomonas sp.]|nr:hypothetical protein [Stenotrophomonas sp.]